MKICFIADFFADEINGGGELSNEELINILASTHDVTKIKSMDFLPEHADQAVLLKPFAKGFGLVAITFFRTH